MGFLDILSGLGKAAGQAMNDTMVKNTLTMWEKVKSAPESRLVDFYEQNNSAEKNNSTNRAMALAALQNVGSYQARQFLERDESARRSLRNIREKVSLESSNSAERLRSAIDELLR
jgi:predicted nucleic acid-binding OB-fold protein